MSEQESPGDFGHFETLELSEPLIPATSFANGRYHTVRVLGVGGQKVVYLARDTALDRECAFALHGSVAASPEALGRLHKEARVIARLGPHPNVVTVFDIGEDEGRPYIVSEYVAGGDVRGQLQAAGGILQVERACEIVADVLEALEFIHTAGIVHRDLKPDNIWLAADGTAKVGDFGIAASNHTTDPVGGMMAGTPAYMAPEQANGVVVDGRTDLYALGVVVFELLAGEPPFTGSVFGVISQHMNKPPPSLQARNPSVSNELSAWVTGMLAKDPSDRPASASAALAALEQAREAVTEPTSSTHAFANPALGLARVGQLPYFGRLAERRRMTNAIDGALAGSTMALAVAGEPGIGKSRLASELTSYAQARGALVLRGVCTDLDAAPPYQPFVGIVEAAFRALPASTFSERLAHTGPVLTALVPSLSLGDGAIEVATSELDRPRLLRAVGDLLDVVAEARGLVLIFEDLHWADPSSIALIQHIMEREETERTLAIVTYRHLEIDRKHPLTALLANLRRARRVETVQLTGLTDEDVAQMVVSASPSASPSLVASIVTTAGGNPFFVEEILRNLIEEEAQGHEGDGPTTIHTIPDGVRDVIERRLDRLSDDCHKTLREMSAMRTGFTWDVLESLYRGDQDDLLDLLDEGLRAQVIRERPGSGGMAFEFTHALIRVTLYEQLSTPRRVRLHRRIGETMESLGLDGGGHVAELAHHFFEASASGVADRAVHYAVAAGDRAFSLFAYAEADLHFARALELIEDGTVENLDRAAIGEIHAQRGRNASAANDWALAQSELEVAAAALGDDQASARAELLKELCAVSHWRLDLDGAHALALELLELAKTLGRADLHAIALSWLVQPIVSRGDVHDALAVYEEAAALGSETYVAPLALHSTVLYWIGRHEEALDRAIRQTDEAASANDPSMRIMSASNQGLALAGLGEYAKAETAYRAAIELGAELGITTMQARCRVMECGWHLDLFDLDRGFELTRAARENAKAIAFPPSLISADIDMLNVMIRSGRLDEAESQLKNTKRTLEGVAGFHEWVWKIRVAAADAELACVKEDWSTVIESADLCIERTTGRRRKYVVLAQMLRSKALSALGQSGAHDGFASAIQEAVDTDDPALILRVVAAALGHRRESEWQSLAEQTITRVFDRLPGDGSAERIRTHHPVFRVLAA